MFDVASNIQQKNPDLKLFEFLLIFLLFSVLETFSFVSFFRFMLQCVNAFCAYPF